MPPSMRGYPGAPAPAPAPAMAGPPPGLTDLQLRAWQQKHDLELRAQCEPARAEAYLGAGTLTIRVPFSGMAPPAA